MKIPSRSEIVAAINSVYDAVNSSKAGPIYGEDAGDLKSLGYQAFIVVLGKVMPTSFDGNMITEEVGNGKKQAQWDCNGE